jgi:hypothetical protein
MPGASLQAGSNFFISATASGLALEFFKPFNPVSTGVSFLGDKMARVEAHSHLSLGHEFVDLNLCSPICLN